tara:strand:+ start:33533 stop:33724 length:192 start_codon:yes stop_codon:yes gene_type:complete
MINAGAIATTSLIPDDDTVSRFNKFLKTHENFACDKLTLEEELYHSESITGNRNCVRQTWYYS